MNRFPSIFRTSLLGLYAVLMPGCTAPRGPLVVTDPDPSIKIPAIEVAVQGHDLKATPQLVRDLESDDPAVRFYAIEALHKLTGERFGYLYYADEEKRQPAVDQWKAWLAKKPVPTTTGRP